MFRAVGRLGAGIFLLLATRSAAGITLYSSEFNNPPFAANPGYWAGVDGWFGTEDPNRYLTGVVTKGGAVYIGGNVPAGAVVSAIRPLDYDPVARGTPIVKVRAKIAIYDSTNGSYDIFGFGSGSSSLFLGALLFDNRSLTVFYNDGKTSVALPGKFVNNASFDVTWTADYSTNRASATIRYPGGIEFPLFTNQLFHGAGAALNLRQFEVLWLINSSGTPGNNFMTMDFLSIEALAAPKLSVDKGVRHRVRRATYVLRGRQGAEDQVTVQVRAPGKRGWSRVKGTSLRWSYAVKRLQPGRNTAEVRLLDVLGRMIDRKKVVLIRQ